MGMYSLFVFVVFIGVLLVMVFFVMGKNNFWGFFFVVCSVVMLILSIYSCVEMILWYGFGLWVVCIIIEGVKFLDVDLCYFDKEGNVYIVKVFDLM